MVLCVIQTIFENEHFLVVDKPSAWLTVPGREGARDPRPCLSLELRTTYRYLLPVHRLDFEVSGLVLFAKDEVAHRAANSWFEGRLVHKTYEALTEGDAPAAQGPVRWDSSLLRGKKRAYESPRGKPSLTIAQFSGMHSLGGVQAFVWRLEPLTGRSHQLRYELAKHGYSIIGDALYGSKRPYSENSIALRSVALDFRDCRDATVYGLPEKIEVKGICDVI